MIEGIKRWDILHQSHNLGAKTKFPESNVGKADFSRETCMGMEPTNKKEVVWNDGILQLKQTCKGMYTVLHGSPWSYTKGWVPGYSVAEPLFSNVAASRVWSVSILLSCAFLELDTISAPIGQWLTNPRERGRCVHLWSPQICVPTHTLQEGNNCFLQVLMLKWHLTHTVLISSLCKMQTL